VKLFCAATLLVIAPLAFEASAAAQDVAALAPRADALRRRLDATPSDTAVACELGFVLVRMGRTTDAIARLDPAITALGEPSSAALRRRLAMCLYTRGRAAETVDDRASAVDAYRRSLALRPDDEVAYRLSVVSLPPPHGVADATQAERAALALVASEVEPSAELSLQTLFMQDGSGAVVFHVVEIASQQIVVVACSPGCVADRLVDPDVGSEISLRRSEVRDVGGRAVLTLRLHTTEDYRGEGGPDEPPGPHTYTAEIDELHLRWLGSDGALHGLGLVTNRDDPDGTSHAITVELRADGNLVVRRRNGPSPPDVRALFGAPHTIESLDCRCTLGR